MLDPTRGTLRGWVSGIARNRRVWRATGPMRRPHVVLTAEVAAALLDPNECPVGQLERKQRRDQVRALVNAVISTLPAPNDRIMSMHWLGEQPACEIAIELGLSGDQVRAVIRRATRKLTEALRCHGFHDKPRKSESLAEFETVFDSNCQEMVEGSK